MPADEFEVIRDLFAPLATSEAARGLCDDVAVLEASGKLVVTTDAIVEGVHFLPDDPIETVAKKALRANLSDLTAKGAKCVGLLLSLIWPDARPSAQIAEFARGLGEDLNFYDVPLLGGDTTSTPGPLAVSITMFGAPLGESVPSRAEAKPGEHVWVTGFIGEAYLGLHALQDAPDVIGASPGDREGVAKLIEAYRTPRPPIAIAETIARYASASADISDGLAADAANIARASGVALRLHAEAIPLSAAGHAFVSKHGEKGLSELVTGGDDYQVLFTAAPEHRGAILKRAREVDINVALIGDVVEGDGVRITAADGSALDLVALGHRHRLGR